MKKEIKEFLVEIAESSFPTIKAKAKQLLDNDLKDETLKVFDYRLNHHWNKEEFKDAVIEKDFVKIIDLAAGDSNEKRFINENFDKFPKIVDILYEVCKPQEPVEEEGKEAKVDE